MTLVRPVVRPLVRPLVRSMARPRRSGLLQISASDVVIGDGFEYTDAADMLSQSHWSLATGDIDATTFLRGDKSYHTEGNEGAIGLLTGVDPTLYYAFYWMYTGVLAAEYNFFQNFNGSFLNLNYDLQTDGTVRCEKANDVAYTGGVGSIVLSPNTWYMISGHMTQDNVNGSGSFYVDGQQDFSFTGEDTIFSGAVTNHSQFRLLSPSVNEVDYYFDELIVYDGSGSAPLDGVITQDYELV